MLKSKLLGATAAAEPVFIEDVFSTYLYTGNGSTQTITNGIDLAGEGGMVWIKSRSAATDNFLFDTIRGTTKEINSNSTAGQATLANSLTAFNADGFSIGSATGIGVNAATYASWTFRKAERFFDVVTYTGNGSGPRAINHNLGSTPGCYIIKRTDGAYDWVVYHRGVDATSPEDYLLYLYSTSARVADNWLGNTAPTETQFYVGSTPAVNASGGTYVAYLFAHDPLGPSGDGSDGLIACGSFTASTTSTTTINLGWEPQWVLVKDVSISDNWYVVDNMRGFPVGTSANEAIANILKPNSSDSEFTGDIFEPTATGFQRLTSHQYINGGNNYIYIAIRRGPMREPTSGTEVFAPLAVPASTSTSVAAPFPPDLVFSKYRTSTTTSSWTDRLRGLAISSANNVATLRSESTAAEVAFAAHNAYYNNNTFYLDSSSAGVLGYFFRRAPGFFDVVAYTGNGVQGTNIPHNLGVAPDLMIVKKRDALVNATSDWRVYVSGITHLSVFGSDPNNYGNNPSALSLNATSVPIFSSSGNWDHTHPTNTYFRLGDTYHVNRSGSAYIAYLLASLPGISKVGSYTGNGSTQTIDCGFTAGARFVLIKRTDQPDAWYVWDSARGIVAGNDPYLQLNSTAAEVTSTDHIDPANSGFTLATSFLGTNNSAGTYIYLAIA